jgi:hypothetical protein
LYFSVLLRTPNCNCSITRGFYAGVALVRMLSGNKGTNCVNVLKREERFAILNFSFRTLDAATRAE